MKDRILKIMQKEGLTNAEFAEKIGISTSSLSHIFSGRNKPSLEVVMRIHKACPYVNINWLLYGEGEMEESAPAVTGMDEEVKYIEKPHPKITEIRIFFDNGTYEVFKPEK